MWAKPLLQYLALAAVLGIFGAVWTVARAEQKHFKIERFVDLSPTEAEALYQGIAATTVRGYALSREPAVKRYRKWRRYNTAPYRSAAHGNRYVNNYGNAKAGGYNTLKPSEKMPPGAVLVKDSFTVSTDGVATAGALFIMEKLARGAAPDQGDWRYVMVMPDGSYFGDSRGQNRAAMAFCNVCHGAQSDRDRLLFVPEGYRR